ncbi:MAG: YfhO family protein [bacterium]|nr:YfhO family protein [bacterium]
MGREHRRVTVRECLIQCVILAALLMVLFPGVCFKQELAVPGTLLYEWAPWSEHAPSEYAPATNDSTIEILTVFALWYSLTREAIEAGEWPLWNPWEFGGLPLLANYQSAILYPIHLLHTWFDTYAAMSIYVLMKAMLCGFSAYVCARVMGLGRPASRLVSVAWMLCGFNIVWLYWPLPDVNAWLPIVLIGAEWILAGRSRRGFFALSFGAVLMLLAGHPETAFVNGCGVGLYFVVRLILDRRPASHGVRAVGLALGAWAIALLVCAAQILPLAEYIAHSHTEGFRAVSEKDRFFVTYGGLVAMWVPRFFGCTSEANFWGDMWGDLNSTFQNLTYVGIPVLACAALTCASGKWAPQRRRQAIALAVAGGFLFLLACNSPAVSPLNRLPVIRAMRGVYYMGFVAFALAMIAGIGLEHWWSRRRSLRALLLPLLVLALPTAGVFVLYRVYGPTLEAEGLADYAQYQIVAAAVVAVATLIMLVQAMGSARPKLWISLMACLLAADLIHAARDIHPTCRRSDMFVDTDLTRFLQEREGTIRVEVNPSQIRTGILPSYRIEEQWGYDGIYPRRILEFYGLAGTGNWANVGRLASVTHYVFPEGGGPPLDDKWEFVQTLDGLDLYEDKTAFPRAFLVNALTCLESEEAVLRAMSDPEFDPMVAALTDRPGVSVAASDRVPSREQSAEILERSSGRTQVSVSTTSEAVLVLTDAWYPGWKATIDGEAAEILPVYHAFRGVIVPPGESVVAFRYDPMSFKVGLGVSFVAMSGGIALALAMLLRARRARHG